MYLNVFTLYFHVFSMYVNAFSTYLNAISMYLNVCIISLNVFIVYFCSYWSLVTFIQSIKVLHIKSYSSCLYIILYSTFHVVNGWVESKLFIDFINPRRIIWPKKGQWHFLTFQISLFGQSLFTIKHFIMKLSTYATVGFGTSRTYSSLKLWT
jgi:hypothetical protein